MPRLLLVPLLLLSLGLSAQTSLEQVLQAARQQSPLSQQPGLSRQIAELEDQRLARQWFPNLSLNAQGSYQSDVITFPENPMFAFPELPQAQYRATLDLQQPIYDGGRIAQARQLNLISQQIAAQQTEVDLAALERQVTQQYFAILQAEQQQTVLQSSLDYLAERRSSVRAAIENGVLLPGALASLDQQVLSLQQQQRQLQAMADAQRHSLAVLLDDEGILTAELTRPNFERSTFNAELARAELGAFSLHQAQLEQRSELLSRNLRPTLAAFASGGVGQPNPYNFLETDFDGFYLLGLRLSWSPWDWGRTARQQQQLDLRQQQIDLGRQRFEQGVNAQIASLEAQIAGLQAQIEQDEALVKLQQKLVDQAEQQLDLGTLTPADYLDEVNALTRAQQQQELRKLQVVQLKVERSQVRGQ